MPTWLSSRIYRHEITTGQMQASVTSLMAEGTRILKQYSSHFKTFRCGLSQEREKTAFVECNKNVFNAPYSVNKK